MGFCMLVVCGLNKLALFLAPIGKAVKKDKDTEVPQSNVMGKVLLSGVFLLVGLFCWKTVVRNRVWSSRETLFR